MSNDYRISKSNSSNEPKSHNFIKNVYIGNSNVDSSLNNLQNLDPQLEKRGSDPMSVPNGDAVPQSTPTQVELYYLRFTNATFSWDMTKVVDEVWKDKHLTFDDKLEFIRKITAWDIYELDVDCSDMFCFSALVYAVRETSYESNTSSFLMKHINSMNYPAKRTAARALGRFDESKECLEDLLNSSTEWEIIQQCKCALRSIYERSYPNELYKLDFDVADRADPNTKPDRERARIIGFTPVSDAENAD